LVLRRLDAFTLDRRAYWRPHRSFVRFFEELLGLQPRRDLCLLCEVDRRDHDAAGCSRGLELVERIQQRTKARAIAPPSALQVADVF
jgi:hypothetical protein